MAGKHASYSLREYFRDALPRDEGTAILFLNCLSSFTVATLHYIPALSYSRFKEDMTEELLIFRRLHVDPMDLITATRGKGRCQVRLMGLDFENSLT